MRKLSVCADLEYRGGHYGDWIPTIRAQEKHNGAKIILWEGAPQDTVPEALRIARAHLDSISEPAGGEVLTQVLANEEHLKLPPPAGLFTDPPDPEIPAPHAGLSAHADLPIGSSQPEAAHA